MKEKCSTIHLPIYGYRVNVIYTDSIKESRLKRIDILERPKGDLSDSAGLHTHVDHIPNESFIFIDPYSSNGTIAHEVWHSIWELFKYIGADFENEIVGYHLGYIIDEIDQFKSKTTLG